jgi:hypothetical protein
MKKIRILSFIAIVVLLASCSSNGKDRFKIDTDKINLKIKIHRFDKDVYALDTNKIEVGIPNLRKKYGVFFDIYTQKIMQLGSPDSAKFVPTFRKFLTDSMFHSVYQESLRVFDNVSDIEQKLTVAFKYMKYYFPEKRIPTVYMHVSGFNQSVVVNDSILSLSIDNYLGADYIYYKDLVFDYELTGMVREKAASDYMMGWLMSEFPQTDYSDRLLDNMLYRGKIMFLLETIMPQEKEETLMAYKPEQLKWCYANEKQMWTSIIEQKHLFMNDRMLSAKYINEAPSTAFFPAESPGRTGVFIGWEIIRSYMKNNRDVGLKELMNETDYQKILEKSKYRP